MSCAHQRWRMKTNLCCKQPLSQRNHRCSKNRMGIRDGWSRRRAGSFCEVLLDTLGAVDERGLQLRGVGAGATQYGCWCVRESRKRSSVGSDEHCGEQDV